MQILHKGFSFFFFTIERFIVCEPFSTPYADVFFFFTMSTYVKVTIHAAPVRYKIAREEITAIHTPLFFGGLWRKDDLFAYLECL